MKFHPTRVSILWVRHAKRRDAERERESERERQRERETERERDRSSSVMIPVTVWGHIWNDFTRYHS